MTTATRKKAQVHGVDGKRMLVVALDVIEHAGKRVTKLAHEGKKKLTASPKDQPKVKAS